MRIAYHFFTKIVIIETLLITANILMSFCIIWFVTFLPLFLWIFFTSFDVHFVFFLRLQKKRVWFIRNIKDLFDVIHPLKQFLRFVLEIISSWRRWTQIEFSNRWFPWLTKSFCKRFSLFFLKNKFVNWFFSCLLIYLVCLVSFVYFVYLLFVNENNFIKWNSPAILLPI